MVLHRRVCIEYLEFLLCTSNTVYLDGKQTKTTTLTKMTDFLNLSNTSTCTYVLLYIVLVLYSVGGIDYNYSYCTSTVPIRYSYRTGTYRTSTVRL